MQPLVYLLWLLFLHMHSLQQKCRNSPYMRLQVFWVLRHTENHKDSGRQPDRPEGRTQDWPKEPSRLHNNYIPPFSLHIQIFAKTDYKHRLYMNYIILLLLKEHFHIVCCLLHIVVLVSQKHALPKVKPNLSSWATKSSNGNHSGSPDRVKSVLELLSWNCKQNDKHWVYRNALDTS